MSPKKILIVSMIWGHRSIAQGIYDSLKDSGHNLRLEIIKIDPFLSKSYNVLYRFFPWLFKAAFQVSKFESANKIAYKYFESGHFDIIEKTVRKAARDIIINTYPGFNSSLEKLIKKYKFEHINVISDPWTFSKIHVTKGGINLVFDKFALRKIKRLSPHAKSQAVGWFTGQKYYQAMDKAAARKNLWLDTNKFTICISGGSEGTYHVLKIVGSLIRRDQNLQILFMCGENKQLYKLVAKTAKIFAKYRKIKVIPYRYTKKMDVFVKASDLVVGKAGPNTIFECVAAQVPFFAITHISGQEDGNLDLIKKYRIGYVEENPINAVRKIREIIKHPQTLKKLQKPLSTLANYNAASSQRLNEIISSLES